MSDAEEPPHADRRRKCRRRVLLGGVISTRDGAQCLPCSIRSLSEKGARIATPRSQTIPADIFLIIIRDQVAHEAEVAWRNPKETGLVFRKAYQLSELEDPKLVHLKNLWQAHAAR